MVAQKELKHMSSSMWASIVHLGLFIVLYKNNRLTFTQLFQDDLEGNEKLINPFFVNHHVILIRGVPEPIPAVIEREVEIHPG